MSQSLETVNSWLNELASLAGIDSLELNEQGVAGLRFGQQAQVIFELPEDSDVLQLYSPMGDVPEEDPAAFFRKLLEWNMFGLETRGASFAIDKDSGQVILGYSVPVEQTDMETFHGIVGNFAEVSDRFVKELQGISDSEAPADASALESDGQVVIRA